MPTTFFMTKTRKPAANHYQRVHEIIEEMRKTAKPSPRYDRKTARAAMEKQDAAKPAEKVEPAKPATEIVPAKPAAVETWAPGETEGIPAKNDTFHIVTLHGDIYNGKRIPFKSLVNGLGGSIFPVYMVANQENQLMRVPSIDPEMKALGWYYRAEGVTDDAMEQALKDLKRLRTWQRKTYHGKTNQNPAIDDGEIKLPARGTLENFQINARSFYGLLRGLPEKTFLQFGEHAIPAQIIRSLCALAESDEMTVTTEQAEKTALVLKYGKSITRLYTQAVTEKMNVIPCMI